MLIKLLLLSILVEIDYQELREEELIKEANKINKELLILAEEKGFDMQEVPFIPENQAKKINESIENIKEIAREDLEEPIFNAKMFLDMFQNEKGELKEDEKENINYINNR